MAKGKDKRQHKRMRKPLTVKYRVISEDGNSEWGLGAVLNIGAGGMLFYHSDPVKKEDILELQFTIENTPVDCKGRVVREEEIPHMALTAVVFTEIDESDKQFIDTTAQAFHPEPTND